MKKTILFFLFSIVMVGQEAEVSSENYFWQLQYSNQPSEEVIGAKNCYVRQEPNANSVLLDSLQMGQPVTVLESTKQSINIKGLYLNWVKINYIKNKKTYIGYLWKGFLAINSVTNKNVTFITTVDRKFKKQIKSPDNEYEATIYGFTVKAINLVNGSVAEKSFTHEIYDSLSSFANIIDGWGLKNCDKIYRFGIGGEACAIPINYFYFGYNGTTLFALPKKYEVGDANAYYHSEEFVFPKEKGGLPNTIIKNIKDAENTDYDSNEASSNYLVNKTIEYYNWDGTNYKLTKTKKLKPYREKG